jgi:2,3-bisphosphoglycerate-independent phosphoglycerate mutase
VIELVHSATRDRGWTLLITSDHGNADLMIDSEGKAIGSHSDRPVPFVVVPDSPGKFEWLARRGSLANVAASLLTMMGIQPPASMAASLVERLTRTKGVSNVQSVRAG